ncbi:ATP-dependent DNA helicase RecG [bacterium]
MQNKLDTHVQYLKGVGPKRAKLLEKLGILSVKDLLYYFPRTWIDRSTIQKINDISVAETATVFGEIVHNEVISTRSGMVIFKAAIDDGTGVLNAYWFRRRSYKYDVFHYLKKQLACGIKLFLTGTVDWEGIKVIEYEVNDSAENLSNTGRVIPVYSLTENVDNKFVRSLVKQVLEQNALSEVIDHLPDQIIQEHNFLPLKHAIRNIHFPDSIDLKNQAYKRLVFDEFFLLECALLRQRQLAKKEEKSHTYKIKKNLLTPFKKSLAFEFTNCQKHVINEIFDDMACAAPMNRLLQGDVGSGKTVVALSALLLGIENGLQGALMAPTEVLAEQHYLSIKEYTKDLDVKVGFLVGSMKKKEKTDILARLENGEIDIIVGTHALISDDVKFKNLALIIIDEQHRFGVYQRLNLRRKGFVPDVLVMTATPIPRTLALTVYGDLDVSTIRELPKGRKKIATKIASQKQAFAALQEEVSKGRQGYVVYPAVDENKLELRAATAMCEYLRQNVFPGVEIGLLHGKLPTIEKNQVMSDFKSGKIKILVATTVIEVGIDVPNATVMIIEHAERFGLATLHQLRGRVGRGVHESKCFLVSNVKIPDAVRRLKALVNHNDGFMIADEDLRLRGPGEFIGGRQHGLPELRIGDLLQDSHIISLARSASKKVLRNDFELTSQENILLKNKLSKRFGTDMVLIKVG